MNMNRIQVCLWLCSFSRRFTKILSCARLQAEHPKVNMLFQSLLALARGQGSVWLSPSEVHRVLARSGCHLRSDPSDLAVTSRPGCLDQTHPPSSQGAAASHACQLSMSPSHQASNINPTPLIREGDVSHGSGSQESIPYRNHREIPWASL